VSLGLARDLRLYLTRNVLASILRFIALPRFTLDLPERGGVTGGFWNLEDAYYYDPTHCLKNAQLSLLIGVASALFHFTMCHR